MQFDNQRQLFTGTAGVPPATRRRRAVLCHRFRTFSRFALIAGGTPAVPVDAMTGLFLTIGCEYSVW